MSAERGPADVLAEMWSRMRYVAVGRLDLIIRTACAMAEGSAADDDVEPAVTAAHKLVGALSTYGFPEGSRIARRAETVLLADEVDPSELDEVVAELLDLRSTLDQGPTR